MKYIKALALCTLPSVSFAAGTGVNDLTSLSTQLQGQLTAVSQLLIYASYVVGVGFALMGVLQFKTHKENPQQMPLGKPVMCMIVAACLLFLPSIIQLAGTSLLGGSKNGASGFNGSTGFNN
jgi:intracellular multiplication protein IcmD